MKIEAKYAVPLALFPTLWGTMELLLTVLAYLNSKREEVNQAEGVHAFFIYVSDWLPVVAGFVLILWVLGKLMELVPKAIPDTPKSPDSLERAVRHLCAVVEKVIKWLFVLALVGALLDTVMMSEIVAS